jgi:hypothetical protein
MEQQFYLKCPKCKYFRRSTGLSSDLTDLQEVRKCTKCGGPRTFQCPACRQLIKLTRERPNVK